MGLTYESLDKVTRRYMNEELQRDVDNGVLYLSSRLTTEGRQEWPSLLAEAVRDFDDSWLAEQLRMRGLLKLQESRNRRGKIFLANVPVNAPETLAEGEFNRLYARGVCLRAIVEETQIVVYRAKEVTHPRSTSEAMIGTTVAPLALLGDLRTSQGVETALGIPPGPNSGLSIKLL